MIETTKKQIRSDKENKYYHGLIVPCFAEKLDCSNCCAHAWIKGRFDVESTASLLTNEFEDLMQEIRNYALHKWGLVIPLPN